VGEKDLGVTFLSNDVSLFGVIITYLI